MPSTEIHDIAEKIRYEPFNTLTNNCLIKAFKFKSACRREGIKVAVVVGFGIVELRRFGLRAKLPFFHSWAYVNHTRTDVARPLDQVSPWGNYDIELKSLVGVWIW